MALAQDLKNKLTATTLAVGLSVAGAFGAAAPATAQDAGVNQVVQTAPLTQYASLSSDEARNLSKDRVLLHFGAGFPEETRDGIIEALRDLNYNFVVVDGGGPEGMLDLYINEQQGKQPFTPSDAITYLGYVLEQNASQFKLANSDQTPELNAG